MLTLGSGSLSQGYPYLLAVIFTAGILQVVLSRMGLARWSKLFPAPVVEGMLTSIGLMIIVKQIPSLIGHAFQTHDFWPMVWEAPHKLMGAQSVVSLLGLCSVVAIFVLTAMVKKTTWGKVCPPLLIVVVLGTIIAEFGLHLSRQFLIHIPENPLLHGFVFPDFKGLLVLEHLWASAGLIVVTLCLIDGIESLATITAIDKIDPYRRKSDPDRTLFAMGVSNIFSSLVGGLTIIPGGVKSTANIVAGGKTQWANFYNACFLLLFLFLLPPLINHIPLTVLAAVLITTGYKLCRLSIWVRFWNLGLDQFVAFVATIAITLTTDLMWGIIGGTLLSMAVNAVLVSVRQEGFTLGSVVGLLQSPIASTQMFTAAGKNSVVITINRPVGSVNVLYLMECIEALAETTEVLHLYLMDTVTLIDHSALEQLHHLKDFLEINSRCHLDLSALDDLEAVVSHHQATRLAPFAVNASILSERTRL
jgi:MFS superfamily sulfate permease-like transporter